MAVIEISTTFGNVIAKPMRLVDIHDVCDANEEEIQNSCESISDKTQDNEVAPESTPSTKEVSSVLDPTDTPTEKQ